MPVERRGESLTALLGQRETGGTQLFRRKATAFVEWHEPDEARVSCPDLWEARGEIPRAYSADDEMA